MAIAPFPIPLVKPDVPISGIRLSDRLPRKIHGGALSGLLRGA